MHGKKKQERDIGAILEGTLGLLSQPFLPRETKVGHDYTKKKYVRGKIDTALSVYSRIFLAFKKMPERVVNRTKRAAVAAGARPTFSSSGSWLRLSLFVTACLSGGLPAGPPLRHRGGGSMVVAAATDVGSAAAGEGKSDHPRATPDALLRHYKPFSFGWMKGLVTDKEGCSDWRTVGYSWRPEADFASNMSSESANHVL